MKRLVKLALFLGAGLLVLVVVGVIIAITAIDGLAKRAVEHGGTYALGATTRVSSVDVGIFRGTVALSGLRVDNPAPAPAVGSGAGSPAFASDHFLSLGDGRLAVALSSLRQSTVQVPTLALDHLDVNLERKGGVSNYAVILDNLKKVSGGGGQKPQPAPGEQKRFVIRDLDLRNINVHVNMLGGPGAVGELTKVNIPLDRVHLTDVGQTGSGVGGSGVTLSELTGIIVKAVLAAAADKGGGIIPADVLGELKGKLAAFQDLDKLKMEVIGGAQKQLQDAQKKIEEEGKKKLDEAAEKLKGLIPGQGEKRKKK